MAGRSFLHLSIANIAAPTSSRDILLQAMAPALSNSKIMIVLGARPQFIKSAPLIRELSNRPRFNLDIVHTGQHYDREMSTALIQELHIKPSVNLGVGSGTHATQTALMMKRLEARMIKVRPDIVLVPGDTNTTLASAITAAKLRIAVAHLEAGLRSGDMTMPEEINRKVTDHCSSLLFAPTRTSLLNLEREGLGSKAHLTGDTSADALRIMMPAVMRKQKEVLDQCGLDSLNYVLVTLHRPSNVDDPDRLRRILSALRAVSRRLRVVFPVHPRTHARLTRLKVLNDETKTRMSLIPPQGFVDALGLLRNASCLLTDSGGMQKESFMLHVPCVTVRPTTEWPETLVSGANRLVMKPDEIFGVVLRVAFDRSLKRRIKILKSPFGDGHASSKVADILQSAC
jgi:UDP-N-acetylglucosamine 2-epimerase